MNYEEWLQWREEYFEMKDIGEYRSPRGSTVGNPNKKSSKRVTKKRVEEGAVSGSTRRTKAEYLQHHTKTVATVNEKGEYELKPTKYCKRGDVVWVLEDNNTFTKTVIY